MCARALRWQSPRRSNRVWTATLPLPLPLPLPLLLAAGWLLIAGPPAWAQPGQEEERAIAALRKLGATVVVDDKAPGKPAVAVNLSGCAVTEAGLAHLGHLTQVRTLDL